jgi:peptide chain release factor 3
MRPSCSSAASTNRVTEPVCCNGLDDPRMAWLPPKAALAKLREEVEIAKGLLALCAAQAYRGAI